MLPKARVFRDSPLSRHLLADATLALLTQLALPDGVSQAHRHAPHRLHMQGSQLICSACFLGMNLSAKGSGQGGSGADAFEEVRYEGYGPGGVAVLIESLTDTRTRAAAEIRLAFNKNGGNLGETGCVGYLFEHRSVVRLSQPGLQEEVLLEHLLNLEDQVLSYEIDADGAEIIGPFEQLEALQDNLRRAGLPVSSWEHRWIAHARAAGELGARQQPADGGGAVAFGPPAKSRSLPRKPPPQTMWASGE